MGDRLVRYFERAMNNVRGNTLARALSVVLLALSLFFAGVLFLFSLSVERLIPSFALDSRVVVYLHTESTAEEREALFQELRSWPAVEHLRSVSKEDAFKEMEKQLGEWSSIMSGFWENPLPPSLEILLKPRIIRGDEYGMLLEKLKGYPQVEEIVSGMDWTAKLKPFLEVVRSVGWGVAGFFALVALSTFFLTTHLAASLHADELEIYRIVGATPFHAFFPYYLEGLIEASASAFLAAGLLILCVYGVRTALPFPVSSALAIKETEIFLAFAGQWILGVTLTWVAAWLALRRASMA